MRRLIAALFILLVPAVAHAQRQSTLCTAAIRRAEATHPTPPGLLLTIGKVESGRHTEDGGFEPWPWSLNADGQGYTFRTEEDAVTFARAALARGTQTLDVGCMQVDLLYHPTAFRSLEEAFDPVLNADYAARFLIALHDGPARGNWYVAIGLYHSRAPDLAAYYRMAVAAVGAGLPMPGLGPRAGPRFAPVRLALAGGGAVRLDLHRQPARIRRTLSPCQIGRMLGPYLRSRPAGCGGP
ncbi:MAG: hypothetical protein J2P47_16520 [Acetobacteraceae bacterium]|nr:hypothetical protein [Acetobacteraceae bacterium]